ncbi:protein trichome birefringence-like 6 [Primulina tabacum]|uniref:protein trichome birefringence-like 6 n=1 Tax=Primulina tabacum TaxID=48773 RepID=UPI003F5A280C
MERLPSFPKKPIKFLVFSFILFSSVFFLIFFSIWVMEASTPSSRLHIYTLRSDTTSLHEQENKGLGSNSSENVLKDSALVGGDEDVSSAGGAQKKGGEAGTKDSLLLPGNFSLITSLDGVSFSDVSKSKVGNFTEFREGVKIESADGEEVQESDDVLETGDASEEQDVDLVSDHDSDRNTPFGGRNRIEEKNKVICDITKGKWVIDENYPLYTNASCPFVDEGFNCQANGRADKDYMKWRWQPQDCYIPRFNATKMLELIRGKRVVFVGDSINRNQWESMLCLLMGAVKDRKKVYEIRGRKITKERGNFCFMFEDYKCRVEFYVSHFLVRESTSRIGGRRVQTLRIDRIDKGSSRWKRADILVFNTGHWWSHHKTKAGINYYQEGDQIHPQLHVNKAFHRALSTWASWVDNYINRRKTRIFFTSSAPSHFRGGLWNTGGHCKDAFQPMPGNYSSRYSEKDLMVEEIMRQMKNPVTILNITGLSDFRPDGHPSIYGRKSFKWHPRLQPLVPSWCPRYLE